MPITFNKHAIKNAEVEYKLGKGKEVQSGMGENPFAGVSASGAGMDKGYRKSCRRSTVCKGKRDALIQYETSSSNKSCIASATTSNLLTTFSLA